MRWTTSARVVRVWPAARTPTENPHESPVRLRRRPRRACRHWQEIQLQRPVVRTGRRPGPV
ncbi:hypothetical protein BRL79_02275, partial [Xanthomonas oryzae pv. oryzae]